MTDFIKNGEALGTTPLRRDALAILEAGYQAVATESVIRGEITVDGDDICIRDARVCLTDYERIFFVGIGKCAVDAAKVFEEILGEKITDGIVLDVKSGIFTRLRSFVGTHPFPTETNVGITKEIAAMLRGAGERDLIFTVISGGGSSLLCLPHEMKCETIREITEALWKKGATIQEVNTVRKHISDIQGGQFAKLAMPATVISLIFSDVPGNDVSLIASGPTVMDTTTVRDAEEILARYDVLTVCKLPNCELVETPKDPAVFEHVTNLLVATNEIALEAMRAKAAALGYASLVRDTRMTGYAREVGDRLARALHAPHSCELYGGETTVLIKGDGTGGRNQELALSALPAVPPGVVILAAASDGWDNTEYAGALADSHARARARSLSLDAHAALEKNDSHTFWKSLGGAIETGKTGINVADLVVVLSE